MEHVEEALATLRLAGWSEDRSVDITGDLAAIRAEGIEPWPELEAFLRQFSGLTLEFKSESGVSCNASLSAEQERLSAGWGGRYGRALGVSFAPIAGAFDGRVVIYAADDGRFFGAADSELWYLGSSPLEVVACLFRTGLPAVDWMTDADRDAARRRGEEIVRALGDMVPGEVRKRR